MSSTGGWREQRKECELGERTTEIAPISTTGSKRTGRNDEPSLVGLRQYDKRPAFYIVGEEKEGTVERKKE